MSSCLGSFRSKEGMVFAPRGPSKQASLPGHFDCRRLPRGRPGSSRGRSCRLPAAVKSTEGGHDIVFVEEADRYYFRSLQLDSSLQGAAPSDFFELLNLELTASSDDVKAAYRALQRQIHPDIVGPQANDMAILLNKAYKVLFEDSTRQAYREDVKQYRSATGGSFNGRPLSAWLGPPEETRAIFVDETTCIGCSHCSACAPDTFFIEPEHGRARVHQQWGNTEDEIREAVDLCPVDCIYYIPRTQLALLEWVLKGCEREDIAIMARRRSGNMGSAASSGNPFVRAEVFMKYRQTTQQALGNKPMTSQDDELAGSIAHAFLALPVAAMLHLASQLACSSHCGKLRWQLAAAECRGIVRTARRRQCSDEADGEWPKTVTKLPG